MPSPSNLYAEKVYAEQPSGLWSLDETVDYVQLLTDADRNFDNWSVIQPQAPTDHDPYIYGNISESDIPIFNAMTNRVITNISALPSSQPTEEIALISPDIDISSLNSDLENFALSMFLKSTTVEALDYIDFGYQYLPPTGPAVTVTKTFRAFAKNRYMLLSGTFDIPEGINTIKMYLKIGILTFDGDQTFEVTAISLGQNAEEYHAESLGSNLIDLPANIALSGTYKAIPAFTYGIENNPGYYLATSTEMYCQNAGVPLVYGSNNTTKLYVNSEGPSLIIPAMGFLHSDGKYRQETLEFWMRVTPNSYTEKRIVGPIASDDGIYINGPFIKLKIGETYGSHYVGEWGRPMLLSLRVGPRFASLLINGEEVISITIDASQIDYPEQLDENGNIQEWIGFYAFSDMSTIEIDCVAIYNYIVPLAVSKRRWVYGQGVDFPENINKAYAGSTAIFDYQFADYSNNYNYPDIASWNNGISQGLTVSSRSIAIPNYGTPALYTDNDIQWNSDNNDLQGADDYFFVLSPTGLESQSNRVEVGSLRDVASGTRAFYGVFENTANIDAPETLFTLFNTQSGDYFKITLQESRIDYIASISGTEYIVYSTKQFAKDEKYVVGLDIPNAIKSLGSKAASVLGNAQGLKMIIGNNNSHAQQYHGKIYKISLINSFNYYEVSSLFSANGIVIGQEDYNPAFDIPGPEVDYDGGSPDSSSTIFDAEDILSDTTSVALDAIFGHRGTYDILVQIEPTYRIVIAASGKWRDSIPLSYLAENTLTKKGDASYEIDFIQFNIGYPYILDTDNALVKTYVSFHDIRSDAMLSSLQYSSIESVPSNSVVEPGDEWINTRYEIVDNNIIYIPKSVNLTTLTMVVHVEISVSNVNEQPIKISKLQLASQTLSHSTSTAIGTKFGIPAYPYSKAGVYYDFKAKNPYAIYKGSTPYLYLTNKSGVTVKGDFQPGQDRGIAIPINQYRVQSYETIAMQLAVRHEKTTFDPSSVGVQVFAVESSNLTIRFYLQSINSSNTRARIYAINARTGEVLNGISYYQNGRIVKNPVINPQEWNMIGIGFSTFLDFNSYTGYFYVNGPLTVSNISHYESTAIQQAQTTAKRSWVNVLYSKGNLLEWDFWATGNFSWYEVLILSEVDYYGVDPRDIYDSYVGTNKIIVGDSVPLRLHQESYNFLTSVSTRSTIVTPV